MNNTVEAPATWSPRSLRQARPHFATARCVLPGNALSHRRIAVLLEKVEALLCPARQPLGMPQDDRALLTLMFTDIVDSCGLAERLGDRAWSCLLARHHAIVREHLLAFRGREIDTAGDGFFASFDTPARAVRCALAIRGALRSIGIPIRVGLHTGECQCDGSRLAGLAVHVAARVADCAAAGEIMVSGTVRDLVAGSDLRFSGGEWHALRGICEQCRLFLVCGDERLQPLLSRQGDGDHPPSSRWRRMARHGARS